MANFNILLCSEDYIKTNSNLNDNFFGKNLLPSIREAQEIYLQQIIGTSLYESILQLVDDGAIGDPEYSLYKDLLDNQIRPYLLYQTIVNAIPLANVKLSNYGTTLSDDQYLVNLSQGDAELIEKHFQNRADFYARRLQEYILNYCKELAVDECTCEGIRANLKNAASTGIFLGGQRGRILTNVPPTYRK